MSARDVIADIVSDWSIQNGFEVDYGKCVNDYADEVITRLRAQGFEVVPRMPTEEMELRGDEDRSSAAAVWFNMLSVAAKETP